MTGSKILLPLSAGGIGLMVGISNSFAFSSTNQVIAFACSIFGFAMTILFIIGIYGCKFNILNTEEQLLINNTKDVTDIKLASAYNQTAQQYQLAKQYKEAIEYFDQAITFWNEKNDDQDLERAIATINICMCEVEILLKNKRPEKIKAKKVVISLKNNLKEIKAPKLKKLLTEKIKELIKAAELILLSFEKKLNI
jgi:tetratricopeptide (TPR) repeat protein